MGYYEEKPPRHGHRTPADLAEDEMMAPLESHVHGPSSGYETGPAIRSAHASARSPRDVPLFKTLSREECEAILSRNSVGRIAFALHDRVKIVPIHYVYMDGWVYGRTSSAGKLRDILRNRRVAFEVDEQRQLFDWRSVIVRGPLYVIQSDGTQRARAIYQAAVSAMRRLIPESLTEVDPVPFRDQLFRIRAAEVSGRAATPTGGDRAIAANADAIVETAHSDMDAELLEQTQNAIARLGKTDSARVRVEAADGIVVLSGTVETADDRHTVEAAVLEVPNVLAVVEEMETAFPSRPDSSPVELARAAFAQLQLPPSLIGSGIKIVVEHGWLRLEGAASSRDMRDDVMRRVRNVAGSRGVIDRLRIVDSSAAPNTSSARSD